MGTEIKVKIWLHVRGRYIQMNQIQNQRIVLKGRDGYKKEGSIKKGMIRKKRIDMNNKTKSNNACDYLVDEDERLNSEGSNDQTDEEFDHSNELKKRGKFTKGTNKSKVQKKKETKERKSEKKEQENERRMKKNKGKSHKDSRDV